MDAGNGDAVVDAVVVATVDTDTGDATIAGNGDVDAVVVCLGLEVGKGATVDAGNGDAVVDAVVVEE